MFSSKITLISRACLAIMFSTPLYSTQLSNTRFMSRVNSSMFSYTLWFSFFFIVPKSIGSVMMSKQSSMLYFDGSTGSLKQKPPLAFEHIVRILKAFFCQASSSLIASSWLMSISSGCLIISLSSGYCDISSSNSSQLTSLAFPKLSERYSRQTVVWDLGSAGVAGGSFFLALGFLVSWGWLGSGSCSTGAFFCSLRAWYSALRQSQTSMRLYFLARWEAILLVVSVMVRSQPFWTSTLHISRCPSLAAQKRGVWPAISSFLFRSTCRSISLWMIFSRFSLAAQQSGVCPYRSLSFRSSPRSSRRSRHFYFPSRQTQNKTVC